MKSTAKHRNKPINSTTYVPPQAPTPLPISKKWALLAQMSPERFMKEYWHKKPLLVREAIPAFALADRAGEQLTSPIGFEDLKLLAAQKTVESRLITSSPWSLRTGPLRSSEVPALKDSNWTMLVQGMNHHHAYAQRVLSWFRFIPDARLDDVMISIAGPGGSVGPHVDSYDVFLIQMAGRRHWKISNQTDLTLHEELPLKILKRFEPTQEWVLEPGDMLYLPPHIAHEGTAIDAGCQTWSVGFRAPTYRELITEVLWRTCEVIEEENSYDKLYSDPHQTACVDPSLVPEELIKTLHKKLKKLRWSKSDISCTLASVLTEPKPQVYFEGPASLIDLVGFRQAIKTHGLHLAPASKLLHDGEFIYLNGESVSDNAETDWPIWLELAKNQSLSAKHCTKLAATITDQENPWYAAYAAGWILIHNI